MQPLPHQIEDSERMAADPSALNWSEAGTGKTFTTLLAIEKGNYRRGVVLAPPIAATMWEEALQGQGFTVAKLTSGKISIASDVDFVVTTYTRAAAKLAEPIRDFSKRQGQKSVLVLDESHYLQNPMAARTQAVFGRRTNGVGGLVERFNATWSLTGTPVVGYYNSLWAQLRATKPDILREYECLEQRAFINKFCVVKMKQYHPRQPPVTSVINSKNEAIMRKMLDDAGYIRRLLVDVEPNMPELRSRVLELTSPALTAHARKAEEALKIKDQAANYTNNQAFKEANTTTVWRELGVLKASSKELQEYIVSACESAPVLLGVWFRDTGNVLYRALSGAGLRVAEVNGSTTEKDKDKTQAEFNSGGLDVIVGQMGAMGVSWNLQAKSNHVIIIDDHFSSTVIEQFYKRVYRMGQQSRVQLDFIKAKKHPLDTALEAVRTRKQEGVDEALDEVKLT